MTTPEIIFHGAAGEVTGSKHQLILTDFQLLFDCGLYQAQPRGTEDLNRTWAFEPANINAVIVSHAHLDHVGLLPALINKGFRGKIYATPATRDLTELILLDSAHLQEQDAEFAAKHLFHGAPIPEPLYTLEDIPNVMKHFVTAPYGQWNELASGIRMKFFDAGHILGSAVTVVEYPGDRGPQRIAYTGDLGRYSAPLLNDPQAITEPTQSLILESTYGTRLHHPVDEAENRLAEIINLAHERRAKIIVPAFSLGRTQELVYLIHRLTDEGRIPRTPIVVDSPLASRITEVYKNHQKEYDQESRKDFSRAGEDPLVFKNLRYTHTVDESKALNSTSEPLVIISASGMASGGRVIHHLRNNLANKNSIILFTGYQAAHTMGRHIISGAPTATIHGQVIPIHAQIEIINDLSAHADLHELTNYAKSIPELKNIFLVHGEDDRREALKLELEKINPDWKVILPVRDQTYQL